MRSKKNKSKVSSRIFNELAAKNVRKSAKDYAIYFFTLMLSVCLFYSFNSISTQFSSLGLEDTLSYLAFSSTVLNAFSLLVCVIMGGLVVYANRFLLRRRKKELGIYATLGMERRDLNHLLMKETLQIGLFSLAAGLVLGIFAAQVLSLITAKLIGVSLASYTFMISGKAIIMSIIFFGILFFFVHLFNVKELKKISLLDMIYADRKNETAAEGNKGITLLMGLLSIAFIAGGYGRLVMTVNKSVFVAVGTGGLLIIIGTMLFFTSALRVWSRLMKANKWHYYRRLNMFTASQFTSRLRTEGKSIGMTAVLLFLSLSLTILGPGSGKYVMNGIENADPYSGSIYYPLYGETGEAAADPMERLERGGFKINEFSDRYETFMTYETESLTTAFLTGQKAEPEDESAYLTIMGVEDYNRLLALQNIEPVRLGENEFGISYAFPPIENTLKAFGKNPRPLVLGDTTLTLAENGFYHYAWQNKNVLVEQGTIIVPQNLTKGLPPQLWGLNFNFSDSAEGKYAALYDKWFQTAPESYVLWARQEVLISITADNLLTTYLGMYLGITFLITSGAVLALQQLGQSSDNVVRYNLLKKLGASKKELKRSLIKQLWIYFGFPLLLGLLHSAVVTVVVFRLFEGMALMTMLAIAGSGTLLILAVYAVYFVITYVGSRRILQL